jgi:hypothetical protein
MIVMDGRRVNNSLMVRLLLSADIPTEYGIKDLSLAEGCEFLVAETLRARVAKGHTPGYDVYGSTLFPNLCFQVKVANAREHETIRKTVAGRISDWRQHPTWTWSERRALRADFYILFGVKDATVIPFVVPLAVWAMESYPDGNDGRVLRISTEEYAKCGRYERSYRKNKFWQYKITDWPDMLIENITHYIAHPMPFQEDLF